MAEGGNDYPPTPPVHEPVRATDNDTMPYPYPKYRDEPGAEAHVYAFLQTWDANHVSQRLREEEVGRSKIMEFGMSLEGSTTWWHKRIMYYLTLVT